MLIQAIFWSSIFVILFTYFGFPLILFLRSGLKKKSKGFPGLHPSQETLPTVSLLIAVHNEEHWIVRKLQNVFSLFYPAEKFEVIVASDGSTDRTNVLVSARNEPNLKLLILPRQGKNRTLNAAASIAKGDVLIFTDADTLMKQDALLRLVGPLQDATIGAVAGDYRYIVSETNTNQEKTYWKYDRILKQLQSQAGSVTSATGQIYAIRRNLFRPIPEGLTDDFFVCVQAPSAHKRLVFEPSAIAFGPTAEAGKQEFDRKVRVITCGLKTVWSVRHLLNPFRYGFYSFQLLVHKVLRRLLVLPLLLIAISSAVLWKAGWIYQLALLFQLEIHLLAATGYLFRNHSIGRLKVFGLPFFFDLVNLASLVSLFNLWKGSRHDIWKPERANAQILEAQR